MDKSTEDAESGPDETQNPIDMNGQLTGYVNDVSLNRQHDEANCEFCVGWSKIYEEKKPQPPPPPARASLPCYCGQCDACYAIAAALPAPNPIATFTLRELGRNLKDAAALRRESLLSEEMLLDVIERYGDVLLAKGEP